MIGKKITIYFKSVNNMTQELIEIFEGRKVPKVRIVDYTTPKRKEELKGVISTQQKILSRKEVDWQQINYFVIKI